MLRSIDAGGMGEVFRAHDVVLEREVAVKVMHGTLARDPGFIERFRREARAAGSLNHPNIIAVFDRGETDGTSFMVMELVHGHSLRDLLTAVGQLQPAQAADVLRQVLRALDHAHRRGVVHRDLKPENVIVTADGIAKVADFGLARAYADARSTRAGAIVGTPQYLAPEQVSGDAADPRTDLYSLGVLAFELLTGTVPFAGDTPYAVAYRRLSDDVPPPSSRSSRIDPALDPWVAQLTARDPDARPSSADAARRALEPAARDLPPARPLGELVDAASGVGGRDGHLDTVHTGVTTIARPTPAQPRSKRSRRGRRLGIALVALLATLAFAWSAWTYAIPHEAKVPDVLGLSTGRAVQLLGRDGLDVRVANGRWSDIVPSNRVLTTDPPPHATVSEDTRVVVTPSLGPEPVAVPSVLGMSRAEARQALDEADLTLGPVARDFSDVYAPGEIDSQSVPLGETAPRGSGIEVTVSRGPRPFALPDVREMNGSDAAAQLEGLGLNVETIDVSFLGLFGTTVVDQVPAPGATVRVGDSVELYLD